MNRAFLVGFIVTVGIISWYEVKECHDMPWPPKFVAAGITFGMLDLFSVIQPELAGVMAIGITLAAIVNKGFQVNCQHSEGTMQPTSYNSLQNGQPPQATA